MLQETQESAQIPYILKVNFISLLCLGVGFIAGYIASIEHTASYNMTSGQDSIEFKDCALQEEESPNFLENPSQKGYEAQWDEVDSLGSRKYACNTLSAFEELSSLHARTLDLGKRHKTGEANRDRTAIIDRKFESARAAESAFRQCVLSMVPELLTLWDEKLEKNELVLRSKPKHAKETNEITLDVLKETADDLELSA